MYTYNVGIREVHVTTIEVISPVPLDRSEAVKQAILLRAESDYIFTEYSHDIDQDLWTVEEG